MLKKHTFVTHGFGLVGSILISHAAILFVSLAKFARQMKIYLHTPIPIITGVTGRGGAKGANAPSGTFLGAALWGDCFT